MKEKLMPADRHNDPGLIVRPYQKTIMDGIAEAEAEAEAKSKAGTPSEKKQSISFNTAMVRAILEGRKTQTRRRLKTGFDSDRLPFDKIQNFAHPNIQTQAFFRDGKSKLGTKCPYGSIGDLLWVKECFYHNESTGAILYAAQNLSRCDLSEFCLKSPADMPERCARIWLQIKEIGVERLQDISETDCIAEGISTSFACPICEEGSHNGSHLICDDGFFPSAEMAFQSLWQAIYGVEYWEQNPWVWVIKFKVLSTTGKTNK